MVVVVAFQVPLHRLSHHTRDYQDMAVLVSSKMRSESCDSSREGNGRALHHDLIYPMTQCHLEPSSLASILVADTRCLGLAKGSYSISQMVGNIQSHLLTSTIFLFPGLKVIVLNWQTALQQQGSYLKNCNLIDTKGSIWKLKINVTPGCFFTYSQKVFSKIEERKLSFHINLHFCGPN